MIAAGDKAGPDGWQRRDAWQGVLFLAVGAAVTWYAFLAGRNGVPLGLWCGAVLAGPLFVLLGGNAIFRSLRAGRWIS